MSLYILCRIHCSVEDSESLTSSVSVAMKGICIYVRQGGLEADDEAILVANGYNLYPAIDFGLSAVPNGIDATGLWNEAMEGCRKILLDLRNMDPQDFTASRVSSLALPPAYFSAAAETRVGRAIDLIVNQYGAKGGVIALVDGGIEQTVFCYPNECVEAILRFLLVPWDCSPNAAYVWISSPEARES